MPLFYEDYNFLGKSYNYFNKKQYNENIPWGKLEIH